MKCIFALFALIAASFEAKGLITPTATSANTDSDPTFAPALIWNNVGNAGDSSGEYLGNGWMITANHVGRTDATHIDFRLTLGGVTHLWTGTGFQLDSHDIFLARLSPDSFNNLPDAYGATGIALATATPAIGSEVTLAGYGRTSSATNYYTVSGDTWMASTINDPSSVAVYSWGGTPTKTWGTNTIWGTSASGSVLPGTDAPLSSYTLAGDDALAIDLSSDRHGDLPASQDAATPFETTAALNDSGSGMFINSSGTAQLVGLVDTVLTWDGQPGSTTTVSDDTMAIDLTRYASEINAVIVPEPGAVSLVGTVIVMTLLGRYGTSSRRR